MRCSCCCYFTPHCTGTPGRHDRYPRTTKLEQVCRRPRGRSECRRVTPRTGLQPGAGTLERTVPRVCVGSATGAETAPRITREWSWNGPQPVSAAAKWKIEKTRFSRWNTAPSPDLCSPACPKPSLVPTRPFFFRLKVWIFRLEISKNSDFKIQTWENSDFKSEFLLVEKFRL